MTQINKLATIDELEAGDLLPFWDTSNGDARKGSLSLLLTFLAASLAISNLFTRQNAAPSATGFTVTVGSGNTWLILTPVAGYAAGTVTLPIGVDGQEVLVNCTQVVTALTVAAGADGASVIGAPTTLAANDFFRMRFDDTSNAWYRIG